METQPAPLDGMGQDGDLDEFRVGSPREIQALLKQLHDGSVRLHMGSGDGAMVTTALWTMDSARGTVGFNADPTDPALRQLLDSGQDVVVVGYLESVKLQFYVKNPVLVTGQRASVLACEAPREMFRFQRRNAFRVRPLPRAVPVARLVHPDLPDAEYALRVIDVSIGGCGLFLPADLPGMNGGALLQDVRIELDDDTRIEVSMRLQHVSDAKEKTRGVRLGFEFKRIGGDSVRVLQRYIDMTQKRGKLMALS